MDKITHLRIGRLYLTLGMANRFGIGFSVDSYGFSIEFLCFWFNVER